MTDTTDMTKVTDQWHFYPQIEQPCPVMALTADTDSLWAGGYGGVAHYVHESWQPQTAGLHLTSVAALARVENWLFAGGAGGIARSGDDGASWQAAGIQGDVGAVTAIAASTNFKQDSTALAATLSGGILRTTNSGASWIPANFGIMSFEITALAWLNADIVLAATIDGIYRSPNGGRAWRICEGTSGGPFTVLAVLPDGAMLAAVEFGGLLRSDDDGLTWTHRGDLPPDIQVTTILAIGDTIFVGSFSHGILSSTDNGQTWQALVEGTVFVMAAVGDTIYAGTDEGILVGTGQDWHLLSTPLNDLRRLLVVNGCPLAYGTHSTPVIDQNDWITLDAVPLPVTILASAPDGALLASSPSGLVCSRDGGKTWVSAISGMSGCLHFITFRADGTGFAGSADGSRLLRTHDFGVTWENLSPPFGVLPLTALQLFDAQIGMPAMLIAATFDPRRNIAQLWRSLTDGNTWECGAEIKVNWPLVLTLANPSLFTIGGQALLWQPDGQWDTRKVGDGSGIRRMVGNVHVLFALTTSGIFRSGDSGLGWELQDTPSTQVVDLALDGETLYILLAGGQVCRREI